MGREEEDIKEWILNYNKSIAAGKGQAKIVVNFSPSPMQIFEGQITPAELDAVVKYITEWTPPPVATDAAAVVDKLAPVVVH